MAATAKYILDGDRLILCQSNAQTGHLRGSSRMLRSTLSVTGSAARTLDTPVPPTGSSAPTWATPVTGGLHGKDLSKSRRQRQYLRMAQAQETGAPVELVCAIGDDAVDGIPYGESWKQRGPSSTASVV